MSVLQKFFLSPIKEAIQYKELIFYQTRSEFKKRHFLKVLGPIWWLGEAVFLTATFLFVSTFLIPDSFEKHRAISVIIAVLTWQWFAKSVNSAPNLLLSFRKELTRTNFPISPLLFTQFLVQLMIFGFSLIIIFIGLFLSGITLTMNIVFLPAIIIIQFTMIVALVSNLAKFGLFYRDLGQIVPVLLGIWFFLSPSIYRAELIPEEFRYIYNFNPFATIFPAWRDVLINGMQPDLIHLGIWFLIFLPLAIFGLKSVTQNRDSYYKRL